VRVYASVEAHGVGESAGLFKQIETLTDKYPDDPLFKMGGVHINIDGPVESGDAALLESYEGRPDQLGSDAIDSDALNRFVRLLDARGWQITLGSTGDRAVRMALNALEHAARSNAKPERGRRHRIEGVALVDAADVPRFGRLGAIALVEPEEAIATREHVDTWIHALGAERASRAWPCASIVSGHGRLAFGTGWPELPLNPLAAIETAATRDPGERVPDGGWAAERVTLKRAVTAFTSVAAYASFDEQRKGTLQKGMLADLVVLSNDIFEADEDPPPPSVVATIFDGKIVYQRNVKSTN
jgi:predicted amidohydrolase YtcJ